MSINNKTIYLVKVTFSVSDRRLKNVEKELLEKFPNQTCYLGYSKSNFVTFEEANIWTSRKACEKYAGSHKVDGLNFHFRFMIEEHIKSNK